MAAAGGAQGSFLVALRTESLLGGLRGICVVLGTLPGAAAANVQVAVLRLQSLSSYMEDTRPPLTAWPPPASGGGGEIALVCSQSPESCHTEVRGLPLVFALNRNLGAEVSVFSSLADHHHPRQVSRGPRGAPESGFFCILSSF